MIHLPWESKNTAADGGDDWAEKFTEAVGVFATSVLMADAAAHDDSAPAEIVGILLASGGQAYHEMLELLKARAESNDRWAKTRNAEAGL